MPIMKLRTSQLSVKTDAVAMYSASVTRTEIRPAIFLILGRALQEEAKEVRDAAAMPSHQCWLVK